MSVFNQEDNWLEKVIEEKGEQWKDPQVIAKGYYNAQEYIKELERQTAEQREDLAKKAGVEELLEQLQKGQAQPPAGEPSAHNGGTESGEQTTQTDSEERLKSLIEETLTSRERQNSQEQNLIEADKKLSETFGTEAKAVVEKRARELGMDMDRLKSLAAESPTAFFTLIGEQTKKESNPTTAGSVNTAAGAFNQSSKRDFQYYQQLRRSDPKQYYTPKIQNQMVQDRQSMSREDWGG